MPLFLTISLWRSPVASSQVPRDRYELDGSERKPCYRQTSYLPPAVTAPPQEVFVLGSNGVSRLEKTTATQGMLLHFVSEPTHKPWQRRHRFLARSQQQTRLNINNTSESVSYCRVFFGFHHPNQGNYGTITCVRVCEWRDGVALNSQGKNLKSSRLILSEAFRISTLYFISICEKRCHTAFASSYLLQLMFNSIQFNSIQLY